jgi:hypothetical protein
VSYTQYRHKIEGVIESPEDVDIIPVKIPHDLYMAFGAKVTSNQRDVVVNLLPANMLYSPLENGRGIYRDCGDEKEFAKHYTDITGSADSRYFNDEGKFYYQQLSQKASPNAGGDEWLCPLFLITHFLC